jgi:uncharacterized Tic20 family protein
MDIYPEMKDDFDAINEKINEAVSLDLKEYLSDSIIEDIDYWVSGGISEDMPYFDIRDLHEVLPDIKFSLSKEIEDLKKKRQQKEEAERKMLLRNESLRARVQEDINKLSDLAKPEHDIGDSEWTFVCNKKREYYIDYGYRESIWIGTWTVDPSCNFSLDYILKLSDPQYDTYIKSIRDDMNGNIIEIPFDLSEKFAFFRANTSLAEELIMSVREAMSNRQHRYAENQEKSTGKFIAGVALFIGSIIIGLLIPSFFVGIIGAMISWMILIAGVFLNRNYAGDSEKYQFVSVGIAPVLLIISIFIGIQVHSFKAGLIGVIISVVVFFVGVMKGAK